MGIPAGYTCDFLPGVEEQVLLGEGIADRDSAIHGIRALAGAGNLTHRNEKRARPSPDFKRERRCTSTDAGRLR